jgi:hypothetical protein
MHQQASVAYATNVALEATHQLYSTHLNAALERLWDMLKASNTAYMGQTLPRDRSG